MKRLDEIKARAQTLEDETVSMAAAVCAADALTLVAAVEAVLALHKPETIDDNLTTCGFCDRMLCGLWGADIVRYPCPTVVAIREALGETT